MKKMFGNIILFLCGFFVFGAFSVFAYSDVDEDYDYLEAISSLTEDGVFEGYENGTFFRPYNYINRAEFTKIVVHTFLGKEPKVYAADCFSDVASSDWFSSYVCYAKKFEILDGYEDGSFRPGQTINLAEASKILLNVFEIESGDEIEGVWYSSFVGGLAEEHIIPESFLYFSQQVSRGEMAEMLWRIQYKKKNEPYLIYEDLLKEPCVVLDDGLPMTVDMDKMRETWLSWYNEERELVGVEPYEFDSQLNMTAFNWATVMSRREDMTHMRYLDSERYDYWEIMDWFAGLGLTFPRINGKTYSESIARGTYSCEKEDCTDEFIAISRKSFDSYLNEKGTDDDAHYRMMVDPNFKYFGFGIAVDEAEERYYLAVHVATSVVSDNMPFCE